MRQEPVHHMKQYEQLGTCLTGIAQRLTAGRGGDGAHGGGVWGGGVMGADGAAVSRAGAGGVSSKLSMATD